jgi:hypothetical protein
LKTHKQKKLKQFFIENIRFNDGFYETQIRPVFSKDIIFTKLSSEELANILSTNQFNKKRTVFLPKTEITKNFNSELLELKKINLNDGQITYSKNLNLKIFKKEKKVEIVQNSLQDWILFSNINLSGWKIFFNGKKSDLENELKQRINSYGMTGCVNFFEANLDNTIIDLEKGQCEDTLNIVNSFGKIKLIKVKSAYSDAVDIDFSKIDVEEVEVKNANNDCIDLSSGEYKIINAKLSYCGDKAISVGEKSTLDLKKVLITNSQTGVASKDSSITNIDNIRIKNIEFCLTAYNKKQEFFGGLIKVKNIECENYLKKNDIDKVSKITKKD